MNAGGTRLCRRLRKVLIAAICSCAIVGIAVGQPVASAPGIGEVGDSDVLTPAQSGQVDRSVDKALAWIASKQSPDGSFPTRPIGQPATTSLCLLAFLARGHLPGEGVYGRTLEKGIIFVLGCQKPDGLLTYVPPEPRMGFHNAAHAASYNHAIAGLLLCEVYGMTGSPESGKIQTAVEKAVAFALKRLPTPKHDPRDKGGWRYVRPWAGGDSDLSITSWHLMFLRSAKNAGFEIPPDCIEEGVAYVNRCFDRQRGTFVYSVRQGHRHATRAMAGAGILALSLGGVHGSEPARAAGVWLLRNPFPGYNRRTVEHERFHYGIFYCSQGMFQLGGRYWKVYYPRLAGMLLPNQRTDGSWQPEAYADGNFGNVYTTALTVLSLTPPYQMLPIFQR